jgi:hypothetical protein
MSLVRHWPPKFSDAPPGAHATHIADATQAQSHTTSVAGSVALPAAPVLLVTLSTRCATALAVFGHQARQLPAQPA